MTSRRRQLLVVGAMVAFVGGAIIVATRSTPVDMTGTGTVYGHLWCLGIRFDGEEAYPVFEWPADLREQTIPGDDPEVVLVDADGEVVLREGDRIVATATRHHADGGDTKCAHLDELTVHSFVRVDPAGFVP